MPENFLLFEKNIGKIGKSIKIQDKIKESIGNTGRI
jgi:hypothetical protein